MVMALIFLLIIQIYLVLISHRPGGRSDSTANNSTRPRASTRYGRTNGANSGADTSTAERTFTFGIATSCQAQNKAE
jgi:hypothetical protein